jgi:hypothetical protein
MRRTERSAAADQTRSRSIKIFGERHTGTNFLEKLCSINFDTLVIPTNLHYGYRALLPALRHMMPHQLYWHLSEALRDRAYARRFQADYGWKHSCVLGETNSRSFYDPILAIICLVKHPISWSLSLKRRPHNSYVSPKIVRRMSLEEFLQMPWRTTGRENHPRAFPNILVMWNTKVESYLRLASIRPIVIIRYEDLLDNPAAELDRISSLYEIPRRGRFRNHSASTKGGRSRYEDYRRYYLAEAWRAELPRSYRGWYTNALSGPLLQRFSYEI